MIPWWTVIVLYLGSRVGLAAIRLL